MAKNGFKLIDAEMHGVYQDGPALRGRSVPSIQ